MSRVWGNMGRLGIENSFDECPVCGWQINLRISRIKKKDENQLLLFNPNTFKGWNEVTTYENSITQNDLRS
jgi:hypothetical protein